MTDADNQAVPWWTRDIAEVLETLRTSDRGLRAEEVRRRLAADGPNRLEAREAQRPWVILARQFSSLMVLLLVAAAVVSGLVLGETEDAMVIAVVLVLNAALGFRQEYKAEQAMAALKRLSVPRVRVRRDGHVAEVAAEEIVAGDIVHLDAGARVPADCRLVEAANLRIQESALTGENEPVEKQTAGLEDAAAALGDRRNMAYMGTVVTYGRGVGVVTATGMRTELGRIASLIETAEEEETVLQKRLQHLGRVLVGAALALIAVVCLEAWWLQGMPAKAIFMTAVSMAVAAIPEGLPAVVTISLALGAQRMLRRRALIRRLPAVETLGSVTVICSDKTGTLTQNRMHVTTLVMPEARVDLDGADLAERVAADSGLGLVLAAGALCSDAELDDEAGNGDTPAVIGDPTEGALVLAARNAGWSREMLHAHLPRIGEQPFDSDRKRMTTLHRRPAAAAAAAGGGDGLPAPLRELADGEGSGQQAVAFTKGAVDSVLTCAQHVRIGDRVEPMTDDRRRKLERANEALAAKGIRVLGLAMRLVPADAAAGTPDVEADLVFLGMAGMLDPLRDEVPEAVATCHRAGIRPVMITGDHPLIAANIGGQLGLDADGGCVTGAELAVMDRAALEARVREASIYARVSPEHKLRIVDALQKNGHVVAMTGDGVNDAPALKEADMGVAMGITGTDVAKEASDMVLQDDNFATIVAAVEQGRVILDNIIRFVRFILASNWAEILVMLAAPLLGMPIPLFPVQILWMNLVTDGLPALALGVEPAESDVMRRPPRRPTAPIVDRAMGLHILLVGAVMAGAALVVGRHVYVAAGAPAATVAADAHGHAGVGTTWQTMLFTGLVFAQLALALAERSTRDLLFKIGLRGNPFMLLALVATCLLQLGVIYVPLAQRFFRTVTLAPRELLVCLLPALAVFVFVEVKKVVMARLER